MRQILAAILIAALCISCNMPVTSQCVECECEMEAEREAYGDPRSITSKTQGSNHIVTWKYWTHTVTFTWDEYNSRTCTVRR